MTASELYDAAIVGAGPAGSATATYLARAGHGVVLVDKAAFLRDKACAECLSPAATPLLAELGMLEELEAARPAHRPGFRIYTPRGDVFQGDFAATHTLGGHAPCVTSLDIPRSRLDTALLGAARRAGVEVHEGWVRTSPR